MMSCKIKIVLDTLLKLWIDMPLKFSDRPTSVASTTTTTATVTTSMLLLLIRLLFGIVLSLELIIEIFLYFLWLLHFCLGSRL